MSSFSEDSPDSENPSRIKVNPDCYVRHKQKCKRSRSKDRHRKKHHHKRKSRSSDSEDSRKHGHSKKHSKEENYTKRSKKYEFETSNDRNTVEIENSSKICESQLPPQETNDKSTGTNEFIGPALPPHMKNQEPKSSSPDANDKEIYGPVLPRHLSIETTSHEDKGPEIIGPVLPPHLRSTLEEKADENVSNQNVNDDDEDDDDDDFIGPLPVGEGSSRPEYVQLEERALQMKLDSLKPAQDQKGTVREEWMLELPEVHAVNFGLGPRQFRANGVPDMSNRSVWTETPEDKKAKDKPKATTTIDLEKEAKLKHVKKRDEEQQKIVDKQKKKRGKSLVEIHQEKLKTQKEETKSERRPFNRDTDLKINRFDEAQKKSVLNKAQLLDTRFSSGESKFL